MVVDKLTVESLLEKLKDSLNKIEAMDFTFDMVLGNEDIQDLLDRRMQVAIESCIDIASHIAAELQLPRREAVRELFLLLGKEGIIPKDLAEKMAKAVGFRNILVHEYASIDYELGYSDLDKKLNDLRQFAKEVVEFLEKEEKKNPG